MKQQLFGQIENEDGAKSHAMLCIDGDQPDKLMLYWSRAGGSAVAVLANLARDQGGNFLLTPETIYAPAPSGAVQIANLSAEEHSYALAYRATLRLEGEQVRGEWTHPSGKRGSIDFVTLPETAIQAQVCETWADFKVWAATARKQNGVVSFRGHGSNGHRLQTTLARTGRTRLERYCSETLLKFQSHAESVLGTRFDMNDLSDYGIVLGLAQHHGLPTPLLDWTASPYIAAFFAFSAAIDTAGIQPLGGYVRIFGLAEAYIRDHAVPVVTVPTFSPYVCPLQISGRGNQRLYAQQGTFLVTNIADLEGWIRYEEANQQKTYLVAVDVPASCAIEALADLQYMGLSPATMFPGLDGVCRMLKHEMRFTQQRP